MDVVKSMILPQRETFGKNSGFIIHIPRRSRT
jgi:hypothetical protein